MKRSLIYILVLFVFFAIFLYFVAGNIAKTQATDLNLPPDPGAAGKATLAGIDSDNDGVRDDIQRYIANTYPDSEKTRAALTHLAIETQKALLGATSKSASRANARAIGLGLDCLFYIRQNDADVVDTLLEAHILNTRERSLAYLEYDDQLAGGVFSLTPIPELKTACAFDPDAMEN